MEGFLSKKAGRRLSLGGRSKWDRRWFSLPSDSSQLMYFASRAEFIAGPPKPGRTFACVGAEVEMVRSSECCFSVSNRDRTLVLRTVGTLIQNTGVDDPDAPIPKMGFAVHFTGEDPPCERAAPRIATGLFGEWQFLDDSSTGSKGESRAATFALLPNSYTRRTAHQANGIENNDAAGCGSDAAPITLSLGATDIAPLPAGWSFAVQPASATHAIETL